MGWGVSILGRALARFLSRSIRGLATGYPADAARLAATLRTADELLSEGNTRIGTAIKYLTQSTWSHAALYVCDALEGVLDRGMPCNLVEADVVGGVRSVSLCRYSGLQTRICRPAGLSEPDASQVVKCAVMCIGHQYDLKNVVDLARYLLATPPVPTRWRRRLLALGSGDPTRAICSTLTAQAFRPCAFQLCRSSPG